MTPSDSQHVFISYVRENKAEVDQLCLALDAAQIPYWRDLASLEPGDVWKSKIRDAIRDGSLVFLACFSESSRARDRSNMNEELVLAVDEFRKMPPGRTWLIPVRFDDGDVPEWDLGAGRTLHDLNYVDLFGDNYMTSIASLIAVIGRLMGERPKVETALASVEGSQLAARPELMRQLTKEMLLDPARRIELDDLISQEVGRITTTFSEDGRFQSFELSGTEAEKYAKVVETAQAYWEVIQPFCYSLQVASRWGRPELIAPWVAGIRSIVAHANTLRSGLVVLSDLRHLPAVAAITTAALACSASSNWANLRVLIAEPRVSDKYQSGQTIEILEATGFWAPFKDLELAGSMLARVEVHHEETAVAVQHYLEKKSGKLYTPVADWLHSALRPIFTDQIPDSEQFAAEFDRAEILIGTIAQDEILQNVKLNAERSRWSTRSNWFGRSTWRSRYSRPNTVAQIQTELEREGTSWGPLTGQLFGGSIDRARESLTAYGNDFVEISQSLR